MKINGAFLCLFAAYLQTATSFVVPSSRTKGSAFVLRAGDEYDNILNKLVSPPPPPPLPPPPPVEAPPVEDVASTAASDVAARITSEISVPTPELSIPDVSLPDIGVGGDLPLVPIAIGAIAMLAGVALLAGGGDKTESTTAPKEVGMPSAPSSIGSSDLSVPYDAAARLAYVNSDKSMTYDAFKVKYEADAVADVKAKQKKPAGGKAVSTPAPTTIDLSIPYDAAARLAYDKSDKSMAYDAFKKKFEADAVAEVKAKQKK